MQYIPFIAVILCGVLYRLDGWGKGDSFLPCWPFSKPLWKVGGINYARYLIGPLIALLTMNWVYILTYSIVVSVPYGEKHWYMQFSLLSWFIIGYIFGLASLIPLFALWMGCAVVIMKIMDTDQAIFEFLMGSLGTSMFMFRGAG